MLFDTPEWQQRYQNDDEFRNLVEQLSAFFMNNAISPADAMMATRAAVLRNAHHMPWESPYMRYMKAEDL